jgi:hypothetical protein
MDDLSQSSRFQALFESALQDYQRQTGTILADHPLAVQLQNCDSVDSVTTLLQEQARTFSEFRGSDGKIMKSLKRVVAVLYTLSASTALGEAIGLVRWKLLIDVSTSLMLYPTAIPTRKGHIRWICYPSRCMYLVGFPREHPSDTHVYQAVKDVSTSCDAIVDLFESIEHFISRLDICTRVPSTGAMAEVLVKIMVELISTLALVTKQIKQNRPSTFVPTSIALV